MFFDLARTVPDNLGMLFKRELVMFGPREVLLTSEEPVVKQFLNGRKEGPIGMSEEKDASQVAAEMESLAGAPPPHPLAGPKGGAGGDGVPPQIQPSPGLPERRAAHRRQQRVLDMLHTLPLSAQQAIQKVLDQERREVVARQESTVEIYLKKPKAETKKCGGIGTWTVPAAQLGSSFYVDAQAILVRAPRLRTWNCVTGKQLRRFCDGWHFVGQQENVRRFDLIQRFGAKSVTL